MARLIDSQFYCINCGKRGMDCLRRTGRQKKGLHLKALYCCHCHTICNHAEIKTLDDLVEFKEKFNNGEYKQLAKESIIQCKKDNWWCY